MAAHLRTQIRQKFFDVLSGFVTVNAAPVTFYKSRYHAIAEGDLPAGFIVTDKENASQQNLTRPFENESLLTVEVQLAVAAATGVEDALDEACKLVQHLVANTVFGTARWAQYHGTDIHADDENQDILRADLTFTAYYIAAENAVDVPM
jgi:hypothetical protein